MTVETMADTAQRAGQPARIVRVDCHLIRLPMRRPQRWAALTANLGSWLLLELTDEDGVTGWGEATALAQWGGDYNRYYGETPGTVAEIIEHVYTPLLLGESIVDLPVFLDIVDRAVRGHHYARTALEQALLDLFARRRNVPVYDLLGGRRRDQIPVAHSIGLMDDEKAIAEIEQVIAEGITSVKLKTGEDPARDVRFVRNVRTAFGDALRIGVDANGGWGSAAEALRVIRKIEDCDLAYVEQPARGIVEMERLAPKLDVPLMADETTWTARDVMEVSRRGAADLVSIYTSKAGGLLSARQMDAVALAAGLGSNVNGSGESGIGNLANLHLAAASYSLAESCVIPITGLQDNRPTQFAQAVYTDDVLSQPFELTDGQVHVPTGPGWGIEVDRDKVRTYTIDRRTFGE